MHQRTAYWLAATLWACGGVSSPAPASTSAEVVAPAEATSLDALVAEAPTARWHYDVVVGEGELVVEASIRGASGARLHVDPPAGRFVRDLEVRQGVAWKPLVGLDAPSCRERCRLRYRFLLADAADDIGDTEVADRHDATILSPPTAWLLRPADDDAALVFRVRSAPQSFVTGLWPAAGALDTYVGDARMFWRAPYSAFGTFVKHPRTLGDARVEVAIAAGGMAVEQEVVMRWLDDGMRAVTAYLGRFPVPRAMLIVLPTAGHRVHGKELGGGGASILLWVGNEASPNELARDWVAVHEMVHLAVPMMPYRFGWLSEGLATYVEPLARAQVGLVDDAVVWADIVRGMPNGQPEAGDRGLDRTRTWGRLYWGGAMFALVADVEIRKHTNGKRGLQDALRAVVAAGGHNGVPWSIERFMGACDQATQTTVMSELYEEWSNTPVTVDLTTLWAELGVRLDGRRVIFDDAAPLAYIRKELTRPQ